MILALGATGKTARDLLTRLDPAGVAHVGASRRATGTERHFDWTDRSTWAPALEGVTALYLVKPPHDCDLGASVGELLSLTNSLRRVVLLSEMLRETKSDDDPDRAAERAVENSGLEWTILRPSWFFQNFGPGGGFAPAILTDGLIDVPSGGAAVSLIDTRDVADVALLALTEDGHAGQAYDLSGPEKVTLEQLAAAIEGATGRTIRTSAGTVEEYAAALQAAGVPDSYLDYLIDLCRDLAAGRFATVTDDVPRLLGRPGRTMADYVAEQSAFWAEAPADAGDTITPESDIE